MNENSIEAFEAKLLDIIKTGGTDGSGLVTISAEDLLNSVILYKQQTDTIKLLRSKIELMKQSLDAHDNVILWQKRAELLEQERDLTVYDFNELYKSYSQIIHESVSIKRKSNSTTAENNVLKEALWSIAVAETDDVDTIKEYAGATLESIAIEKNG